MVTYGITHLTLSQIYQMHSDLWHNQPWQLVKEAVISLAIFQTSIPFWGHNTHSQKLIDSHLFCDSQSAQGQCPVTFQLTTYMPPIALLPFRKCVQKVHMVNHFYILAKRSFLTPCWASFRIWWSLKIKMFQHMAVDGVLLDLTVTLVAGALVAC